MSIHKNTKRPLRELWNNGNNGNNGNNEKHNNKGDEQNSFNSLEQKIPRIVEQVDRESRESIVCCHVDTTTHSMYAKDYMCPSNSSRISGRKCSRGCLYWICDLHLETEICGACGYTITS